MSNNDRLNELFVKKIKSKDLRQLSKIHYIMDSNTIKNAVFSFIIPGLGQYLNDDKQKGLTMFAGAIAIHVFIWFFMNNPIGSLVNTAYHAYSAYDVYKNY